MIVICKRFSDDDVPVKLLPGSMEQAKFFARGALMTLPEDATAEDQEIAQGDIGTELICLLLVEFDDHGDAVRSEVVSWPDDEATAAPERGSE